MTITTARKITALRAANGHAKADALPIMLEALEAHERKADGTPDSLAHGRATTTVRMAQGFVAFLQAGQALAAGDLIAPENPKDNRRYDAFLAERINASAAAETWSYLLAVLDMAQLAGRGMARGTVSERVGTRAIKAAERAAIEATLDLAESHPLHFDRWMDGESWHLTGPAASLKGVEAHRKGQNNGESNLVRKDDKINNAIGTHAAARKVDHAYLVSGVGSLSERDLLALDAADVIDDVDGYEYAPVGVDLEDGPLY